MLAGRGARSRWARRAAARRASARRWRSSRWQGGGLLESGGGLAWSAAMVALILSDSAARCRSSLDRPRASEAYRRGSVFGDVVGSRCGPGCYLLGTGDLEEAGEALALSRDGCRSRGAPTPTGSSWARGLLACTTPC